MSKKIILSLSLSLLLVFPLWSQKTIFTGRIYTANSSLKNRLKTTMLTNIAGATSQKYYIDTLEKELDYYPFHVELDLKQSTLLHYNPWKHPNATFFLRPGDSLFVELRYDKFWEATCSGEQANTENILLCKLQNTFPKLMTWEENGNPFKEGVIVSRDTFSLLIEIEEKHRALAKFYETETKGKTLDPEFKRAFHHLVHYSFPYGGRKSFAIQLLAAKFKSDRALQDYMQQNFPAYDWAYMSQFPLEDFEKNRTLSFATVLYFHTGLSLRQSIDSLEKYFSGEKLQTLKAAAIVCALRDNDYTPQNTSAPALIEAFIRNCPDSALVAEVQSNIKREEKMLKEGQEVDFTFQNRKGEAVKLSSLRGKVVLIDVWATWCGPCMDGRKHLKRIQEELGPEKLAVVALSVQKNKEVWKAHIEGKTWFHEWHASASKAAFDKAFGITQIPRYILISPEGLLVRREAQSPHKRTELLQQIEDAWLGRF